MTIINTRKEYWPNQGSNERPPVPSLQCYRLSYGARHKVLEQSKLQAVTNNNEMQSSSKWVKGVPCGSVVKCFTCNPGITGCTGSSVVFFYTGETRERQE